jgi:DNA polymerase elongation subunit (family B)
MSKYYNKILRFKSSFNASENKNFIQQLPKRNDFVDKSIGKIIDADIKDKKPIYFMPNGIMEHHVKPDDPNQGKNLCYNLMLIGVLRDGSKAAVMLNGIEPFFDIRIPDGDQAAMEKIKRILSDQNIYYKRLELIDKNPFKYFHIRPVKYIRMYFYTLFARTKAIHYFEENMYDYGGTKVRLETASDDKTCYYRKASREYKFKLCDWNLVDDYELAPADQYTKSHCVKYTFEAHVKNFNDLRTKVDVDKLPELEIKSLMKDRSMIMCWDLETFAPRATGNAPLPENVFDQHGNEDDTMFMCAATFHWYYEEAIMVKVNITTMPVPIRDDCLIVQCENQIDIIRVKALLMERMAPDFISGFNDGVYDWPFVFRRVEEFDRKKKTGLLEYMKNHMAVIPYNEKASKWNMKGITSEQIKVEADTYVRNEYFDVPGFICMDTRTIFRQLYPTAEKTSLSFFLAANKLGGKEDMPYQTMFKIYRLLRELSKTLDTSDFEKIKAGVIEWQTTHGDSWIPFADIASDIPEDLKRIDESTYNIDKLNVIEILALLEEATLVVHYCNVDAQRCQELLKIRNIIGDRREVANLSYTSMFDAFYRAGGMKVRNLVISEGIEPIWDLVFTNIAKSIKDDRKYPGAYVIPPKKGLYRDHVSVKRRRRETYQAATKSSMEFTAADIDPVKMPKILASDECDTKYPPTNPSAGGGDNDSSCQTDRPCTGLDFSSLYPSEVMAWNLSPEKVILYSNAKFKESLEKQLDKYGQPYKFIEVNFRYGHADESEDRKEHVRGWIVQHHPTPNPKDPKKIDYLGMGLYPYILKKLFDMRAAMKVKMEYWAGPKEFLEKVDNIRKDAKLPKINTIAIDEQIAYMHKAIANERSRRIAEFEKFNKPFYKFQLESFKEIEEFFEKHYFHVAHSEKLNLAKLREDIDFQFNYWNCKQGALKVFMNTFYGETGNSQSPFFMIHVAGAITTNGQRSLKLVKQFVESKGYRVLYGDTDSLYLCIPDSYFKKLDDDYLAGRVDKLAYWTQMIEITMETLDKFKVEVNNMLAEDSKTKFLKMAYEEVLWPYMMVGKKKYIGVKHDRIVNLAICMPECTLDEFMKSKLLFIRGLELKKRGSSEFLKRICYEIVKESFCITTTKSLREIVENKLQEIPTRNWNPEIFEKTARYKLPGKDIDGKPKPGNVTVLKFVSRMQDYETRGVYDIRAPEKGERFRYIVCRKYPWTYDLRGRKIKIKIGDKYEYSESIKNDKYREHLASLGSPMELDLDHYITNEVIGQFARFVIYHPEYDKFLDLKRLDNDLKENRHHEADLLYKDADTKAHNYAKKVLRDIYNKKFARVYEEKGSVYKNIFKKTNILMNNELREQYGDASMIFNITNTMVTSKLIGPDGDTEEHETNGKTTVIAELEEDEQEAALRGYEVKSVAFSDAHMKTLLMKKIVDEAEKIGNKQASVMVKEVISENKMNPYKIYVHYVSGANSICKTRRSILIKKLDILKKRLEKMIPEFQKICADNVAVLSTLVSEIKRENNLEDPNQIKNDGKDIKINEDRVRETILENTIEDLHVYDMYDLFVELITNYRTLRESKLIEEQIAFYKEKAIGVTSAVPPSIKSTKDNFSEWIKMKNNYTSV